MCSDKINTNLNKTASERLAKDSELFFVNSSVVDTKYGNAIIMKKKLKGVQGCDGILIRPIYENVEIVSSDIAIVKLLDTFALFSLRDGRQLSEFEYNSVHVSNDTIVLRKGKGKISLYNLKTSKFLHLTRDYDEFNLKDSSTEYFWARRNVFYDYIHRATGSVISLSGIIMAYDTAQGMFGLDECNKVCKFNECGIKDALGLRQVVQESGGYMRLCNYTHNIEHVIDIYGNILNI